VLGDPLGEQSRMLREDAEQVESPAKRGALLISLWFDPADDGNLRRRSATSAPPLSCQAEAAALSPETEQSRAGVACEPVAKTSTILALDGLVRLL